MPNPSDLPTYADRYRVIPGDAPIIGENGAVILQKWLGPISRQSVERLLDGAFGSAIEQHGLSVLAQYPPLWAEYNRRNKIKWDAHRALQPPRRKKKRRGADAG